METNESTINYQASKLICPIRQPIAGVSRAYCDGTCCALFCLDGDSGQCAFKKLAESVDVLGKIANVEIPFSEESIEMPEEPWDEDEDGVF
jgi:hypothetical protein